MKVLLTGGNGFVGSHILDRLLERRLSATLLLRPHSSRALISSQLAACDVRTGSIDQPASLDAAMEDVTHVIHCAGATKALDARGFFKINQLGTRNVVDAVNRRGRQVERLVLISSLAAAGPGTRDHPRHEHDEPRPVSDYGRSKLAAEGEVINSCNVDWTVVRPPAVYGPRDREFLRLFKAARLHLLPRFGGGRQELSMVYAPDLAAAVVAAMTHGNARREVFFAGSPEVATTRDLARLIGAAMGSWTVPLPLPHALLWMACQGAEGFARLTGKADVLSAQKWNELKAPGWVCDVSKLKGEVGYDCRTPLAEGLAKTADWYRAQGWLRA
jgi:nucleoside-diphosphate-sugar epimerase